MPWHDLHLQKGLFLVHEKYRYLSSFQACLVVTIVEQQGRLLHM